MPGRSISLPFSGALLRELRERHGLTQKQLAERCRAQGHTMSRASVAGYEANDRKPRPDSLQALVAGFAGLSRDGEDEIDIDALLNEPAGQK